MDVNIFLGPNSSELVGIAHVKTEKFPYRLVWDLIRFWEAGTSFTNDKVLKFIKKRAGEEMRFDIGIKQTPVRLSFSYIGELEIKVPNLSVNVDIPKITISVNGTMVEDEVVDVESFTGIIKGIFHDYL